MEAFREAEAIQAEDQPQYPRLYSRQSFRFCNLLLGCAEPGDGSELDGLSRRASRPKEVEQFRQTCQVVLDRGRQFLHENETSDYLLDIALNHFTLARAYLGLVLTTPQPPVSGEERIAEFDQVAEHLNRAVVGLRQAGREDYLPRGLLARAALQRLYSNFAGAGADLTEALEIAERGRMRLYECDAHLEWARLCRDQGDFATARRHVARARELVNETGYGRREREVRWLEETLAEGAKT